MAKNRAKKTTRKSTKSRKVAKRPTRKTSKKTTRKKSTRKPAKKPARKSTRKPTRVSARRARKNAERYSQHKFVSTFLWLVLIDGFLSIIYLLSQSLLGTSSLSTAFETVVGIYGAFVFVLSIFAAFMFMLHRRHPKLLIVPVYVIAAPLLLYAIARMMGPGGALTTATVASTWVAVLLEIILAGWQLNERNRGW